MNSVTLSRKLFLQYVRYKDSPYFTLSVYVGCLLLCLLLAIFVVIPQIGTYFSLRDEITRTKDRITIMNENIEFLLSLNGETLQDDYVITTTALPSERDVSSLLSAINAASITSGVVLDDFSFQGGQLSARGAVPENSETNDQAKITFRVQGTLPQITQLIEELQSKVPILSLSEIDASFDNSGSAEITVNYYTKPLPLISEDYTAEIKPLTNLNMVLLSDLKGWQVISIPQFIGSDSGTLAPF